MERLVALLAKSFGAAGAGLLGPLKTEGAVAFRVEAKGQPLPTVRWPWEDDPELLARVGAAPTAIAVDSPGLGSWLLTAVRFPDGGCWLLWLEEPGGRAWDPDEMTTLALAGLALSRWVSRGTDRPPWARRFERAGRQRRLEEAAAVSRRLAHDFGNVLTGILGFTELALSQAPADSPSARFIREVYRAAQQGADLTQRLRLFGCRQAASSQLGTLPEAAAGEAARLRAVLGPGVELRVDVPSDLPAVAVGNDQLRAVLAYLLENAQEALTGPGVITLSARAVQLGEAECDELIGNARPGPCVEVCVADTGGGLSPEVGWRLLVEPFFSTKPRRRGLGLAVVFGVLRAHGGGFRLEPGPGAGTVVRMVLPLADATAPTPGPATIAGGGGEKVLVVDDDPAVLHMVGATLESAGYQVQTVNSGADALDSYAAAAPERFHLVLSDILMPQMSGIDLAHRLLRHDANANVLFMSGQPPQEMGRTSTAPGKFDLLSKPFRPDALLRAVRTALSRTTRSAPADDGGPGEGPVVPPSR